ncbi:MAG TPA: nucleotidyltransferase family protein [Tepidisphaeraceae bacterium]|jgi:hypothetical protein|nr:nucleotidyltransferase family protein [Tepidisphaeraceae bacterium]
MVAIAEKLPRQQLSQICVEHHVKRLWLFGSTARNEHRVDSDIDLLVEFEPNHTPGFFKFGELADQLSALWNPNRHVDLVTEASLHRLIRPIVLTERVLLYEG